jgi:hypothetical protein
MALLLQKEAGGGVDMLAAQIGATCCPYTRLPFAECAVRTISGATIPKISRYCMDDFGLCPVYRAQHQSQNHEVTFNPAAQ